ncbi:hypothetical protein ACU5AX_13705 [Sphingomonas sp. XXL09]|uniref:hypothetical protein n=1 Tax=Sphingomonas sp. XXL09 TaxID=3457787 RepID=UPI00406BA9E8
MIARSREAAKMFRAAGQRAQSRPWQTGRASGPYIASGMRFGQTLCVEPDLSAPLREPTLLRVFASSREPNLFFGAAQ